MNTDYLLDDDDAPIWRWFNEAAATALLGRLDADACSGLAYDPIRHYPPELAGMDAAASAMDNQDD